MRFDPSDIFMRREFMPWQNEGTCGFLAALFRLCLNTFVIALVITWVDYHFNKTDAIQFVQLVKLNASVVLTGLLTLRITFLALNNIFVMALLSIIDSGRHFEKFVKTVALTAGIVAVYLVKDHYNVEANLSLSYPVAVILLDIFLILFLRSSVGNVVKCR